MSKIDEFLHDVLMSGLFPEEDIYEAISDLLDIREYAELADGLFLPKGGSE